MRQSETKQRTLAAKLVAEDVLTDTRISKQAGIGRATLARWKLDAKFVAEVNRLKAARVKGAEAATESKAFDTVTRLTELANLSPDNTNGTITGQVRACMGIAEIRGEVVQLHGDVTERLRNKTPDELAFIANHGRDPKNAEELRHFTELRKSQVQ